MKDHAKMNNQPPGKVKGYLAQKWGGNEARYEWDKLLSSDESWGVSGDYEQQATVILSLITVVASFISSFILLGTQSHCELRLDPNHAMHITSYYPVCMRKG